MPAPQSTQSTELPRTEQLDFIAGADSTRPLDAVFVNAPLRDYSKRPRVNDYTLPVLGLGYIATYAKREGFNTGVLDAEAHGLGIQETADIVNAVRPRWAGFNLLAPTYAISAHIASLLDPNVLVMAGGHHAKAAPEMVLRDDRFHNLSALILGEGETRVAALLEDVRRRAEMAKVMWRDRLLNTTACGIPDPKTSARWLAPDINELPFVDRSFLPQDPYLAEDGRLEANLVCSRGCPYECGFCGAAASMNPEVTIRTRHPLNILAEMDFLHDEYGVTAFRAVDDLFLGLRRVIHPAMDVFTQARVGERYVWDATGRINILAREDDAMLATLARNGLREVALGIESGSDRILKAMDKRITAEMTLTVTRRLLAHGISVKGYFILGYPGESHSDIAATIKHIRDLWKLSDQLRGTFRASIFTFRPYPGSPIWDDLVKQGYDPQQMQSYSDVDLTSQGADEAMRGRDEYQFTTGLQFGEVPLPELDQHLVDLMREQYQRTHTPQATA
ncbi:B12-binding domain-containing radical SAM protein [Streptomyces sp. NBC_01431]|uniref:B12-binding domain-containing radical SAM protein n=1 Tax=Streptomyces sp. NBC_01431 TaxID=2903863 RepID=UPI002E2F63AA|nr:radical SAM protein [Streptomyces sp. NBC_01431]